MTNISQLDLTKTYSYADYLLWRFEERLELIKGKIFKMSPAPSRKHQRILGELHLQMGGFFKKHPCQLFFAPFDVRLPIKEVKPNDKRIYNVVQPDLCVICDNDKLDDRGCIGAPDLVVEILSPGNTKKEMTHKFELYEEAGVKEYWLVEPQDEAVFVYYLNNEGRYIGLQPAVTKVRSVVFPELEIDLNELWASQ